MRWLKKFFEWLFENCNRTDCRCCGKELHQPGGYYLPFVGAGFCGDCCYKIMKK